MLVAWSYSSNVSSLSCHNPTVSKHWEQVLWVTYLGNDAAESHSRHFINLVSPPLTWPSIMLEYRIIVIQEGATFMGVRYRMTSNDCVHASVQSLRNAHMQFYIICKITVVSFSHCHWGLGWTQCSSNTITTNHWLMQRMWTRESQEKCHLTWLCHHERKRKRIWRKYLHPNQIALSY